MCWPTKICHHCSNLLVRAGKRLKIKSREVRPTYVLPLKLILERILKRFIESRFSLCKSTIYEDLDSIKLIRYKNIPKLSQVNIIWRIKRDCMADFYHKCILNFSYLEKKGLSAQYGKYQWLTCMSWSLRCLLWTVGAIAVRLTSFAHWPGSSDTDFAHFEKGHHERLPL